MSRSDYRPSYERLTTRILSVLWFLVFILASLIVGALSYRKISSSLYWLANIRDIQPDFHDRLMVDDMLLPGVLSQKCQLLWYSRAVASYDLESAYSILRRISHCPRAESIARWTGNLAWLLSDQNQAREDWSRLSPDTLAEWGRVLFHLDDRDRSIVLLELATSDGEDGLSDAQSATANRTLGEFFWSSGEIEKSAHYFEQAWRAYPFDIFLAFQLGRAYAQEDDCAGAIEVLKAGRTLNNSLFSPQLDIVYALQLGECYLHEGDIQAAMAEAERSKELLSVESVNNSVPDLISLNQRQERLAAQIQKLLLP